MNRKQAKQRFTELTGLPALSGNEFHGIHILGGTVPQWHRYAWDNHYYDYGNLDARNTAYWVSIVAYLEWYMEVA